MKLSQSPSKKGPSFHYAWLIAFACFVIMCFGMAVVMNCAGLFIKPVSESFGVSRQVFTLTTTLGSLASMVVAFIAGKVYAKFGLKKVMMVASIGMAAAYSCYAIAPSVTVFYIIAATVGFFMTFLTNIPCSMLITRWFNEKRGLAMGLVFMGSGMGGLLLNPMAGMLITRMGWRMAYLVLGILMAVTIIPCTFFIIRLDPAEMGLEPYGGFPKNIAAGAGDNDGIFLREAYGDKRFWLWLLAVCTMTATCSGMVQQLTSYVSDIGYSYTTAANVSAISLGLMAGGKVILGRLFDVFGTPRACLVTITCLAVSCFLLTQAGNVVMLGAFLLLFALGCSISTVAFPIVTTFLFGKKDYGSVFGIVTVAGAMGTAIGSPAAAAIYDATGGYVPAWYLAMALSIVNALIFLVIFRPASRKAEVAAAE